MDIKQSILVVLGKNGISADDREIWREVLNNTPETSCDDILVALQENPDSASALNDNLKEKKEIIEKKDALRWKEILTQEKDLFAIK